MKDSTAIRGQWILVDALERMADMLSFFSFFHRISRAKNFFAIGSPTS